MLEKQWISSTCKHDVTQPRLAIYCRIRSIQMEIGVMEWRLIIELILSTFIMSAVVVIILKAQKKK